MVMVLLVADRQHVVLVEDNVLDAVDLHFVTGVLPEEDAIAALDGGRSHFAVLEDLAAPGGHDHPLGRFLLGRIGNDDATLGLFFLLNALHYEAVGKRTNLHGRKPPLRGWPPIGRDSPRIGTRIGRALVARKLSLCAPRSRGQRTRETSSTRA